MTAPDVALVIRDLKVTDETAWRHLWEGYNRFYGMDLPETVTAATWTRLLDPDVAMLARLATISGQAIGFSISVVHESSWVERPVLYLEDLFVDFDERRRGAGGALIQDVIELSQERGLARVYWHTRANNPARVLYDRFIGADDFVRYRLSL